MGAQNERYSLQMNLKKIKRGCLFLEECMWHNFLLRQLKLTADHMYNFKLIDGIIPEPLGGAHTAPEEMAMTLKKHIKKALAELTPLKSDDLVEQRIEKYSRMGEYEVLATEALVQN